MENVIEAVQKETIRIREMISETKALLPHIKGNFVLYEMLLQQADKAILEQDTVALIKLLPELKKCE